MSTSIAGVTAAQRPESGGHEGGHGRMKQVMAGAASLLGMSDDDLRSALRSGRTLADLGKEKGVSTDDLIASVKAGLEKAGPPQGPQGAAAPDPTAMATGIVNGTGLAARHGHHGARPAGGDRDGDGDDMAQRLQSVTSALGMDETSFFDALASGSTLKDLASQHDVSQEQLRSLLLGPVAVNTTA